MRVWDFGIRAAALGVGLYALSPLVATTGWAARTAPSTVRSVTVKHSVKIVSAPHLAAAHVATGHYAIGHKRLSAVRTLSHAPHGGYKKSLMKGGKARYYGASNGGLQCVPFARAASGIEIKGNAANWWDAASGVYARGQAPEAGSVLNFRANGHMRLGHVAVVTRVVDSREIEVDHANWAGPGASKGGVSRAIPVQDVSANNDWSAVRVGLGHSGSYGSVYSTYGFIYDRPDNGMIATNAASRPATYDEVAEAPSRAFR